MVNKIHILLISQQLLFRQGVELALSSEEDLEIVGSTDFSNGVQYSMDELPPDIAFIDLDGCSETGLELTQKVKQRLPNVAVITFSSNLDDRQLFQALKAQAAAYLSKEVTADEMIMVLRSTSKMASRLSM